MKRLVVLLAAVIFQKTYAAELMLNPFYAYGTSNFYGQDQIPTYNGSSYGGEMEYRWAFKSFKMSLYGSYSEGSYENTNNNSDQKEELETKSIVGGFKFYFSNLYLKLAYGSIEIDDVSTGTVSKSINLKDSAFVGGIGLSYQITNMFGFFLGLDMTRAKFDPSFGGVTQSTSYINYSGVIGITIQLPSGSSGPAKLEQNNKNGFEL